MIRNFVLLLILWSTGYQLALADKFFDAALKNASGGEPHAQYKLALMYYEGERVAQDYTKGFYWFAKAAAQGLPEAQFKLGYMYLWGYGTEKDVNKTLEWYTRSAEQGDIKAQYVLGLMYENGTVIKKDYAQAVKWYARAAEQGDTEAQKSLEKIKEEGSIDFGKHIGVLIMVALVFYLRGVKMYLMVAMFYMNCMYHTLSVIVLLIIAFMLIDEAIKFIRSRAKVKFSRRFGKVIGMPL